MSQLLFILCTLCKMCSKICAFSVQRHLFKHFFPFFRFDLFFSLFFFFFFLFLISLPITTKDLNKFLMSCCYIFCSFCSAYYLHLTYILQKKKKKKNISFSDILFVCCNFVFYLFTSAERKTFTETLFLLQCHLMHDLHFRCLPATCLFEEKKFNL